MGCLRAWRKLLAPGQRYPLTSRPRLHDRDFAAIPAAVVPQPARTRNHQPGRLIRYPRQDSRKKRQGHFTLLDRGSTARRRILNLHRVVVKPPPSALIRP